MTSNTLRIATRSSALALWQANFIKDALLAAHKGLNVELVPMSTQGDRWLQSPLSEVGGKGLFIKELEQAMLRGEAELAVHSAKDLPAQMPDGFVLVAIGYRDDVADALVCPAGHSIDSLPPGSRIGSSSLRRQALVRARRPDCSLLPVRGNVGTRLAKLDSGEFDALLLACTGLTRLGLATRITQRLTQDWCVPAVGQGALAIECLASDGATRTLLEPLNQPEVASCVVAERALSAALGASCSTPLGGYAQLQADGAIHLNSVLGQVDGSAIIAASGTGRNPAKLGQSVAQDLLAAGAGDILKALEQASSGGD